MAYLVEAFTAVIVSLVVVTRYVDIHRRAYDRETLKKARLMWGIYFCIAVAAIAHVSFVRTLLAGKVGPGFASWPQGAAAWLGYTLTLVQCYGLAPHIRPRFNWPVWTGVMMISLYTCLIAMDSIWHYGEIGNLLYTLWLAMVAGPIAVLSFYWSYRQEHHLPMKLRLAAMTGTHLSTIAWTLNDIVYRFSKLLGYPYNHDVLYVPLLICLVVTFVIGYLTPTRAFVAVASWVVYFDDWLTFLLIRLIESRCAYLLGRRTAPVDLRTSWQTPEQAVYISVISLLDMPKKLSLTIEDRAANLLSSRLALVSNPELDYAGVVQRVRWMGLEYAGFRLWPALGAHYSRKLFNPRNSEPV